MMNKFCTYITGHALRFFFCSAVIIVFALHMSSVHERNLWQHTKGKITYVKEISDHKFMYTIEYMADIGSQKNKVRMFKSDSSSPFKGQEVRLKYRVNDIQDFVLLGTLKYLPDSIQDKF